MISAWGATTRIERLALIAGLGLVAWPHHAAAGPAGLKPLASRTLPAGKPSALAADADAGDGKSVAANIAYLPGNRDLEPFTEQDELVLEIATGKGEQSDTITAYGTRSGVYLPLGAFARFLDLAIVVNREGRRAEGWFLDPKRTFVLDVAEHRAEVEGRVVPLAAADVVAFEGETYLRVDAWAKLLPLSLDVDLYAQVVTITTREPFPFEQRLARDAVRDKLAATGKGAAPDRYPRVPIPYLAASLPLGDLEARVQSDSSQGFRTEADLRLSGDLGYLSTRAFVGVSSREGLTGARIEAGRRDPDARLLGPLRATEFEIGDVSVPTLPIGLRGTGGRGAFITNAPFERSSVFDAIDLRGELPEGYEVELYRNNVLVGSTRTPVNGRYEFLQVPVDFGFNIFRLVFYGPQGQRREEVRRIGVGDGRLAPGKLVYAIGAAQKDVSVFEARSSRFIPQPDFGRWRATASLEYGVSRLLTASIGAAFYESGAGNRSQVSFGARGGIAGLAVQAIGAIQSGGAAAAELGLGGRLAGVSFSAIHAEYRKGFLDEVRSLDPDGLIRASELNASTTIDLGPRARRRSIALSARLRRIAFARGRTETDASLRASTRVAGFIASNTLDFSSSASSGSAFRQLAGSFDLATLGGSRVRYGGQVIYGLLPDPVVRQVQVEAARSFGDRTEARLSAGYGFTERRARVALSAIRRFGVVSVGFDAAMSVPGSDYSVGLRVGFGFGRNPLSRRPFIDRPGLALGGGVAIRAFRDDGDGVFGAGDRPLEGIGFRAGGTQVKTDGHGAAFAGGLAEGARTNVVIDPDSLPDIELSPRSPGYEIVARPGRVATVDVPIVALGAIEGTAFFRTEAGRREVAGLQLDLRDEHGEVVGKARSESDGYFLFEQLKPGRYSVSLDQEQAARLHLEVEGLAEVTVGREGGIRPLGIEVRSSAATRPATAANP